MGKLLDFFERNPGKFLTRKHQNKTGTEAQHRQIVRHFLEYAEELGIFHTAGLTENVLAKYLKEKTWKRLETKRKHKIWLFIMFKKIKKREVKDYVKNL